MNACSRNLSNQKKITPHAERLLESIESSWFVSHKAKARISREFDSKGFTAK